MRQCINTVSGCILSLGMPFVAVPQEPLTVTERDLHPQPWKNKHWILGAVLTAGLPEGSRNNLPGVSQQESHLAALLGASSATDHVRDF